MRLACNGLSPWFEKKATVVTPSRLLASVAGQQFTQEQLELGIESWQRPSVYSVDGWLTACWQEARYSGAKVPTLLSLPQERLLWQEIIEKDAPELFDVGSTARLAMAAARVMAEWHISPNGEIWSDYQDAQHFLRWLARFRQRCREQGWITRPDIWRSLPDWLKRGWCERQLTVFAGFDTAMPALDLVKQTLGLWGVSESNSHGALKNSAPAHACETFGGELEWTARLVRQAFEQGSHPSLGVVIPELKSRLSEVQRTFENVFYPGDALRLIERGPRPPENSVFHIYASAPAYSIPIIAHALLLLELQNDRIGTANATAILRSPYIAGASAERSARALADLNLRKRRDIDLSLRDMEDATAYGPLLTTAWRRVRNVLRSSAPSMDYGSWSEFIRDLLEAAGWPGDGARSSEEQEAIEVWKDAVSNLATLAMVSGPVSFATALVRLKGLLWGGALETGTWSSPIQILDATDCTGIKFDQAFLTGLSEEHWPPGDQTSPLIPLAIQRGHGIPGSSRQSAYERRERITSALFSTAPVVSVTFSGRLSPLVETFVSREIDTLTPWAGKLPMQSFGDVKLEEREDSKAPLFDSVEPRRGGTSVIKSQSLCPFRAFADHRLLSSAPEEACLGFDSRDRGSFLHKALQFVWEELKTQACLRSTNREDLQKIVREAVLRSVKADVSSPFHQLATSAEWERLERLVLKWLDIERDRAQPFTVETLEDKRSYEIPGLLRLAMRIDRMDRLANGSVLLIDYKSGKQTASKLEGQRPAEPQLLVYAAATSDPVDGVFFGELTPRQPRAVGYGRALQFEKRGIKKDWDTFIEQAKENVAAIALGFVEGKAAVDPIKGACDYCSQKPFCRINEKFALGAPDDDDE